MKTQVFCFSAIVCIAVAGCSATTAEDEAEAVGTEAQEFGAPGGGPSSVPCTTPQSCDALYRGNFVYQTGSTATVTCPLGSGLPPTQVTRLSDPIPPLNAPASFINTLTTVNAPVNVPVNAPGGVPRTGFDSVGALCTFKFNIKYGPASVARGSRSTALTASALLSPENKPCTTYPDGRGGFTTLTLRSASMLATASGGLAVAGRGDLSNGCSLVINGTTARK